QTVPFLSISMFYVEQSMRSERSMQSVQSFYVERGRSRRSARGGLRLGMGEEAFSPATISSTQSKADRLPESSRLLRKGDWSFSAAGRAVKIPLADASEPSAGQGTGQQRRGA